MAMEMIRACLGTRQPWEERLDGWWLEDSTLDVGRMARAMSESGGRLLTITARTDADGAVRLEYHWKRQEQSLAFDTVVHAGGIPSIARVCPDADRFERRIHDRFDVDFTDTEAVLPSVSLHPDLPGMPSRNGGNGKNGN